MRENNGAGRARHSSLAASGGQDAGLARAGESAAEGHGERIMAA